jgi:hypothetical protein
VAAAPLAERIGAADRPAHTLHGALFVVVSLAIAFVAPVSAMTLGPLLLGAPHLVGDLRVLWLQRPGGILDAEILRIFVPLLAMTLVRPALAIGFPEPAMCEVALGVVAIAIAAHAGFASSRRRLHVIAAAVPLLAFAMAFAPAVQLTLAHAHNVVAFAAWLVWTRHRGFAWGAAGLYVAAWMAALALPIADGELDALSFGATFATFANGLAPGLGSVDGALVVRSFVFAQLVHYGIWMFALPRVEAAREERASRGLWIAAVCACAIVPIVGAFDPLGVRGAYLSLVVFHGWFELAVFTFLAARRVEGKSW